MSTLQFRVISEAEADQFERTPHNIPAFSDAFTAEDFSREWWAVRTALKRRLELLGDEWRLSTGAGDFMLSESRGNSRWIYITFTSTCLWRAEFVGAVAHLLAGLPQDYRVGCVTELNDEEMFKHPLVYLVISSTAVFGRISDPGHVDETGSNTLSRFGFSHVHPDDT